MKKILSLSIYALFSLSVFWFASPAQAAKDCKKGGCYYGGECDYCSRIPSGSCDKVLKDPHSNPIQVPCSGDRDTQCRLCGGEEYSMKGGKWTSRGPRKATSVKFLTSGKKPNGKPLGKKVNKKAATCKKYAYASRGQQYANLRSRCGYRGYGWSKDLKRHHKWCMKVSASTAKRMYNFRKAALGRCAKKAHACRRYATTARSQQYANLKAKCGYRGYAWSTNYIHHFAWCMRVSFRTSATATKNRALALRKCFSKRKRK